MRFDRVLDRLSAFFEEKEIAFAVAGGFALHAYGYARVTNDLDFLVDRGRQAEVVSEMERQGYETLYVSEGFSNHVHPDPEFGRVDFIYVSGPTRDAVLGGAVERVILDQRAIPVPRPEHLIAMKLHAARNDPGRELRELADIQFLLGLPETNLDFAREYFTRYGMLDRFDELRQKR